MILRRDKKIAFVLRQNTDYMNGKYSLPAGHAEGDEAYRTAAAREALEEAGVKVVPGSVRHVHTMQRHHGDHVRIDIFFDAGDWEGEPYNAEPQSHSELAWFDEDALPFETIMDFQAVALRCIQKGDPYSEFNFN
jgi:ADP-ribose pyrophosphatase YjhB (NUDIX family)